MHIGLDRVQLHLDWLKTKLILDLNASGAAKRIVTRKYVYQCNLGRGVGSEQEKERPCVILQCFDGNRNSPNTIVAPITHSKSTLDVVVPIATQYKDDGSVLLDGHVLLGNIVTVSKARLGDYITRLPNHEMKLVDEAIAKSLEIWWRFQKLENIIKDKDVYIEKLLEQRQLLQNEIKTLKSKLDKQVKI